jgi:glycine hydroxymethyltransferase
MTQQTNAHVNSPVHECDPIVAQALDNERARQQNQIELIASENIVSRAVLDALGHEMTNKTLEGYPGNRFHGGGQ